MKPFAPVALSLLLAACSSSPTPEPTTPPPASSTPPSTSAAPATSAAADASAGTADIEAAIKAGDGARARQLAEQLIVKNPHNPRAHYYAGVGAELAGDKPGAEKHYRDALAQSATFSEAASNLAVLLLNSERAAEAVTVLRPLAAKSPDDPLVQINYATALAESGDAAGAAPIYERLAQKNQLPPAIRLDYAGVLIKAGKKDDAAKVLRDGLAAIKDDREQTATYARVMAQAGAFDDAIKAMDRAIQLKPGADLLTYRALFKRSAKNLDGARVDLEAAIKENPNFAAAHRYLGEVLEDMKKPADAKKEYEKAIAAEPNSAHAKKATERLDALKGAKK